MVFKKLADIINLPKGKLNEIRKDKLIEIILNPNESCYPLVTDNIKK